MNAIQVKIENDHDVFLIMDKSKTMKIEFPILLDELKFVYRRNHGFGFTPVFKIIVYGKGTVEFTGYENVKTIGKKKWQIEKSKILKLFSNAIELGIFELEPRYDLENKYKISGNKIICDSMGLTDLPSSNLEIHVSRDVLKICYELGAPKRLHRFEYQIIKLCNQHI